MVIRALFSMLAATLVSLPLLAQVPVNERIPVTDPGRLERMGFPRDAQNVFVWSKRDRPGQASIGEKRADSTETWGTQPGFTTVLGSQLQNEYNDERLQRFPDETFCVGAGDFESVAHVQIQLPEGASLGTLNTWAYDVHPDRDLFFQFCEVCQEYGYGDPETTVIAENQTLGAIGNIPGSKSLAGLTVNNHLCAYYVRVVFGAPGESCEAYQLAVRKFEITWMRQVSPAPATATFGDVPTDHPFFQYVEALAKSGITGGCGSNDYCPDAPLTRGQMAVFLAKALGLQWP